MNNLIWMLDFCTSSDILKILLFIIIIIKYIFLIIPIVLLLMLGIDFFKNITTFKENDMKQNLNIAIKRIIYCGCIFFVPTIVSLVISLIDNSVSNLKDDYQSCISNINNIDYYEKLKKLEEEIKEKELNDKIEKAKSIQKENSAIKSSIINDISNINDDSDSNNGSIIGQKYNLTESQLRGIAMVCQKEQGSVKGAMAEASLMANRFELYGSSYGSDGEGLFNYVANSGWFASGSTAVYNTSKLRDDILAGVKEVLVLGRRTLDFYVDEHDCIDCGSSFDIYKIIVNGTTITDRDGLKNHNNYKKDKTIIYNVHTAVYTFYSFPDTNSDPFGYTNQAKNKYNSLNNGV